VALLRLRTGIVNNDSLIGGCSFAALLICFYNSKYVSDSIRNTPIEQNLKRVVVKEEFYSHPTLFKK
jgi:hypothetical protein